MEKIYHAATNEKRFLLMIVLILDKLDFRTKNITSDREYNFILLKWLIHQECIIILIFMYIITNL